MTVTRIAITISTSSLIELTLTQQMASDLTKIVSLYSVLQIFFKRFQLHKKTMLRITYTVMVIDEVSTKFKAV